MNVAKPIKPDEYKAFREELYNFENSTETASKFSVRLDSDPTIKPKNISAKLAEVQAYKDRAVVIYNRALLCESYWKTIQRRVETKFEEEQKRAMLREEVRNGKSSEIRKAEADRIASEECLKTLFKGEGVYDDHVYKISQNLADASAFMSEIRNIYGNLDDTSRTLTVQLKSVMVNAKLFGDPSEVEPQDKAVGYR